MRKEVISTGAGFSTGVPLSQAIRAGSLLFVSGQVGVDPDTGKLAGDGTAVQTDQALKNLELILKAAGCALTDVVKVTTFLTNIGEFDAYNQAYRKFFPTDPPARSTVEVTRLAGAYCVEIEAIALAPGSAT